MRYCNPHHYAPTSESVDFLNTVIGKALIVLPWPSKSPDLNPIEHLMDDLDRRVRQRQPQPQYLQQLVNALQDEWNIVMLKSCTILLH
jgi:transposase